MIEKESAISVAIKSTLDKIGRLNTLFQWPSVEMTEVRTLILLTSNATGVKPKQMLDASLRLNGKRLVMLERSYRGTRCLVVKGQE